MAIGSNNPFPSVLVVEGSAPAAPAAGQDRVYVDSADHLLKWKDSSSVVRLATGQPLGLTGAVSATRYVGGTASVAPTTGTFAVGDFVITQAGGIYICTVAGSPGTWVAVSGSGMTNPMTTTADMIYSSSGSTPARLAAGAAGGVVAMGNGVPIWNAGTAFPASKATNDRYWRTDLGLEFYWDGTRWLSTTLYRESLTMPVAPQTAFSAAASIGRWTPWAADFDLWLVNFYLSTYVVTTNNGTNFWTVSVVKYQSDFSTSSTPATHNTSADAANTVIKSVTAIGALYTPATYPIVQLEAAKTLSPGVLSTPAAAMSYRLVGV